MRRLRNFPLFFLIALPVLFVACDRHSENRHTTATSQVTPSPTQVLKVVSRPQVILDLMKQRGE